MTKSIQSLFAYIATDKDGSDFIPVLTNSTSGLIAPMFYVTLEMAEEMRPQAQEVANAMGGQVRLRQFFAAADLFAIETQKPNSEQN